MPIGHVRESVKQIEQDSWLIGDKFILRRCPSIDTDAAATTTTQDPSWKADETSCFTISDAPVPLPPAGPLPPDSIIRLIYDLGDASAVWSVGDAFLKVKLLQDRKGATREQNTLRWLAQFELSFEIPRVFGHAESDDRSYLIVSRVPGRTLGTAWRGMSEDEKQQCVCRAVEIIKELSTHKGQAITGIDGAELPDAWLAVSRGPHDYSAAALRHNCDEFGMDCSTLVFAHGDLGPDNIMVDSQSNRVTGVIDWEIAGYVPLAWLRTKFGVCWGLEFGWLDVPFDDPALQEWMRRVQGKLGDEGFSETIQAWKEWCK